MKKSIIIIAAVLSLTSCGSSRPTREAVEVFVPIVPASVIEVRSEYKNGEVIEFTHNGIEYTLFTKSGTNTSPIILNKVVK